MRHTLIRGYFVERTESKLMELLNVTVTGFVNPPLQKDLNAYAPKLQLQVTAGQTSRYFSTAVSADAVAQPPMANACVHNKQGCETPR